MNTQNFLQKFTANSALHDVQIAILSKVTIYINIISLEKISTKSTIYSQTQSVLNKILKHSNFIIFSILLKLEDEFPLVFSYYSRKVSAKF